jgi:dienelactone hydrolase
MRLVLLFSLAACVFAADRRKEDLDFTLRVLPPTKAYATGRINAVDKTFEQWQKRTGELPPDFPAMPSIPELPDPLEGVKTRADWEKKRVWIREQVEKWITGRMPPKPDNLRAVVTGEAREGEILVRDVRLEFGPGRRASLRLQVLIPPGKGPFPVFLTNHNRRRPWVATAVRRGYIGCIYFATDPNYGYDDDSDKFADVYPEYDFSCLSRWAWAAMRAVDYLQTLPQADGSKIGISGHSRNGKQALIAAAFDERIAAVVPSSGNTGEGNPWRYTTDPFAAESIEQITGNFPHWFHPRLRFFAGREHKLPVDQNSLMALVAPRGLMLASAYSESQGNAMGFEAAYRSVQRVYDFLGKPQDVGLYLRPGEHPTTAEDIERFVDFFDVVFGRRPKQKIENWIRGYTFAEWQRISGERAAPAPGANRLQWALGEEPAELPMPASGGRPMVSGGWLADLHQRPLKDASWTVLSLPFGDDLTGDLYLPVKEAGKTPVVVYLHPYAYATGYSRYARPILKGLTERGFGVLAFDQIGFGTRAEWAREFYQRYPHWSLLGRMVADTRAAVDALTQHSRVDASRIHLVGYSLGGKVALWSAASGAKATAVVSVAGFTPLRKATREKGTEGIRHYSHLHGLAPRLGFYVGREAELPVDYPDVLRAIAPRPVLVVAPAADRYATLDDVREAVRGQSHVKLETPEDFNRFSEATQKIVFGWLERLR